MITTSDGIEGIYSYVWPEIFTLDLTYNVEDVDIVVTMQGEDDLGWISPDSSGIEFDLDYFPNNTDVLTA